jgi:hypothetical protein
VPKICPGPWLQQPLLHVLGDGLVVVTSHRFGAGGNNDQQQKHDKAQHGKLAFYIPKPP